MPNPSFSRIAACCVVLASLLGVASAQELNWAQKMFEKLNHDFGVVARGADVTYRLKLTNKFLETVHIANVRTSCGCASASLTKDTLLSLEETAIQITMDTRRFTREKNSNVIVTFDKPLYQEVTIPIKAYIRTDVVFTPGSAEFSGVAQGSAQERQIAVSYAGRENWSIKQILSSNEHLAVRFDETSRGQGRVDYNVVISLKPTAPVGELREQLRIITDDQNSPEIPFLVEARVLSEITITPEIVSFGVLAPGETRTVNIVLRGRKPFMVEKIESESGSDAFQIRLPTKPSVVHVLPLIITAPLKSGPVNEEFTVTIPGTSHPVHFKVSGKVG